MLIATLGIMFFSMMDAVMKGQALAMGTYNAMFWRMAMGVLIVSVLYLPTRPVPASGRVLKIHLIRAALTAAMVYLFFFGRVYCTIPPEVETHEEYPAVAAPVHVHLSVSFFTGIRALQKKIS